jgi:hypothetical protein
MAPYSDTYGVQGYGAMRDVPDDYIQFVKDTAQTVREVKPDIHVFVAVATDAPEDNPADLYTMISRLIGHIDGVAVITSADADSMQKSKALLLMLRGEKLYLPAVLQRVRASAHTGVDLRNERE